MEQIENLRAREKGKTQIQNGNWLNKIIKCSSSILPHLCCRTHREKFTIIRHHYHHTSHSSSNNNNSNCTSDSNTAVRICLLVCLFVCWHCEWEMCKAGFILYVKILSIFTWFLGRDGNFSFSSVCHAHNTIYRHLKKGEPRHGNIDTIINTLEFINSYKTRIAWNLICNVTHTLQSILMKKKNYKKYKKEEKNQFNQLENISARI